MNEIRQIRWYLLDATHKRTFTKAEDIIKLFIYFAIRIFLSLCFFLRKKRTYIKNTTVLLHNSLFERFLLFFYVCLRIIFKIEKTYWQNLGILSQLWWNILSFKCVHGTLCKNYFHSLKNVHLQPQTYKSWPFNRIIFCATWQLNFVLIYFENVLKILHNIMHILKHFFVISRINIWVNRGLDGIQLSMHKLFPLFSFPI